MAAGPKTLKTGTRGKGVSKQVLPLALAAALLGLFLGLAGSPLGGYLEERLYLEPLMKLRALVHREPKLDPGVRLILTDDRSLKVLGALPTFAAWQRIAELLFALGFERVLLQEPQNLASQLGEPRPRAGGGFFAVAVVDTLGVKSSRAISATELPPRLFLPGVADEELGLVPVLDVIGPDPASLAAIDRLGINNVDDASTVPLGERFPDGRIVPHLSLLAAEGLRWEAGHLVSALGRVPRPSDGRFHVDFIQLASILDKALPVIAFYRHDGSGQVASALSDAVRAKLAGGRVAVLVPAAYSGSRYVTSPIEGTVPAYLSLVSMVNSALHNSFVYRPLPHALVLLAWLVVLGLALSLLPVRAALYGVACGTAAMGLAGSAALQLAGWSFPCAQMTLAATVGWLVRAVHHHIVTLTERTRLAQQLELGHTVQQLLLPGDCAGRIGAWEYRVVYRPYAAMAGDWFQVFFAADDGTGRVRGLVAIGDVVGKGPSAALLTATIAGVWHEHSTAWERGSIDVKAFMGALAATIHKTFRGRQYSTLALAMIDGDQLSVTSCASPFWMRLTPGGAAAECPNRPLDPLGLNLEAGDVDVKAVAPTPGEVFFAHSDGILDSSRSRRRFLKAVAGAKADTAGDPDVYAFVERQAQQADAGDSLPDDVTLLMLRYAPVAS